MAQDARQNQLPVMVWGTRLMADHTYVTGQLGSEMAVEGWYSVKGIRSKSTPLKSPTAARRDRRAECSSLWNWKRATTRG
jgi:hypothetical protein